MELWAMVGAYCLAAMALDALVVGGCECCCQLCNYCSNECGNNVDLQVTAYDVVPDYVPDPPCSCEEYNETLPMHHVGFSALPGYSPIVTVPLYEETLCQYRNFLNTYPDSCDPIPVIWYSVYFCTTSDDKLYALVTMWNSNGNRKAYKLFELNSSGTTFDCEDLSLEVTAWDMEESDVPGYCTNPKLLIERV